MKSLKILRSPIHVMVMSLFGLCLFSGLDTPLAHADFTFGEPVNLKSVIPVIDPAHECIECFSYDGLEIYLISDRFSRQGDFDLCVLKRTSMEAEWGSPENLGPVVNSINDEWCASISADGLTLYFTSNRPGGYGYADIWMTTRSSRNDPWNPPTPLEPKINTSLGDGGPWISPDGLELYFDSGRPGGYGGNADIYVARRATTNDAWGDPVNLGSVVNSPHYDGWLSLSPDGLLLLFSESPDTTPRPGGFGSSDMWMTKRAGLSDPWQQPVNLGPQVNDSVYQGRPRISLDGSTLYFNTNSGNTWENWQAPIIPICDFNGDGKVDGKDLLCMTAQWGTNDPLCDIGPYAWGDGIVDLQDVVALSEYIGKEVIDSTLVAHWALDETEGNTSYEAISGKEDIVVGDAVWEPDAGKVDGALRLDGLDDCIVPKFKLDPAKGTFSVLAWINGGAPGQVIISQSNGVNWLMLDAEGKLMTELTNAGRNNSPLQSEAIINDGQWHRVAIVWDGLHRLLYCDGIVVAEDMKDGLAGSNNGLYIGAGKDYAPGTFFDGLIDDVRIYNRVVRP